QLTDYQNAAYAERYARLVARVRQAEDAVAPGITLLSEAVARGYYKLLAYKDEYEVARLYTDGDFLKRVEESFDGDYRLVFHMAPPLLARKDANGHLVKRSYGPWMLKALRLLTRFKLLRGGALDPFARSAERRLDRQLIADYEATVAEIIAGLDPANHEAAVELASLPEQIRGFGHVRERYHASAKQREALVLAAFRNMEAPAASGQARPRKTIAVIPG
ncbi:MAG TPA: indolepyruvate ferredoxin oxidoreductase family protein, partial [Accumulibacter sp.]|nr:indolepyruvate ferredoxin oxidoreductase family protein [Accumulibacter sp.]